MPQNQPPLPSPGSGFPEWITRVFTVISENPQVAASYGTLLSSFVALVVAVIALVQARTSRKALEVTRASLQTSREQVRIAKKASQEALEVTRASLDTSRKQAYLAEESLQISLEAARHDRLDQQAPRVAVVPLPGVEYVLSESGLKLNGDLLSQFSLLQESFDWSQTLEVDRRGLDYPRLNSVCLSGSVLLRNDGPVSAEIRLFSDGWEVVDGPTPVHVLNRISFLLEPNVRITLRWFHHYSVYDWMRKADEASRDQTSTYGSYNYKYLGIDDVFPYLSVTSSTIPDLVDVYRATFQFLPLKDGNYRDRSDTSVYAVDNGGRAFVQLYSWRRSYPRTDHERK